MKFVENRNYVGDEEDGVEGREERMRK